MRLKAKLGVVDFEKIKVNSVNSGSITQVSGSGASWVLYTLVGLIFAVVVIGVIKRREARMRGEITQMFAKYSPLVALDGENDD